MIELKEKYENLGLRNY